MSANNASKARAAKASGGGYSHLGGRQGIMAIQRALAKEGFDPGPAVSAAWQQVYFQPTHARELREIAELAIGFGQAEALSHLIDLLPSEGSLDPANDELLRKIVLRHIAFTGSNAEIKAWHHDNQNRLRFSNEDRCFYVSGLLQ